MQAQMLHNTSVVAVVIAFWFGCWCACWWFGGIRTIARPAREKWKNAHFIRALQHKMESRFEEKSKNRIIFASTQNKTIRKSSKMFAYATKNTQIRTHTIHNEEKINGICICVYRFDIDLNHRRIVCVHGMESVHSPKLIALPDKMVAVPVVNVSGLSCYS